MKKFLESLLHNKRFSEGVLRTSRTRVGFRTLIIKTRLAALSADRQVKHRVANETEQNQNGIGVFVEGIGIGFKTTETLDSSNISRISFKVPIYFSPKYPK